MAKNRRLSVNFDFSLIVLGIASTNKVYQMAWYINNMLHFNFAREKDHTITIAGAANAPFPCYAYDDVDSSIIYYLLVNKNNGYVLVPEMAMADFIFLAKGEIWQINSADTQNKLGQVKRVQVVFCVDVNTLKSKNNLVIYD